MDTHVPKFWGWNNPFICSYKTYFKNLANISQSAQYKMHFVPENCRRFWN